VTEPVSREEFQELAVLYELGRLLPDRRERFEAELAARGEEGRHVLEGVRRAFARAGLGPGSTTVSAERAALAAVTARPLRRRRSRGRGWVIAALLFLVLFAAALAWALTLQAERSGFDQERQAAAATVDSLVAEIAARDSLESAGPGATEFTPVIAAPDLATVDLSGSSGAHGRLLASGEGALLVAENLPPLSEDGSYHLWTRTPAWAISYVIALGPASGGYLLARFSDSAFLLGAAGVFITAETGPVGVEPAGATMLQGVVPAAFR
jgi:hypothetical protein